MTPSIYAHRGASGLYPENTMAAFRAALRQGADGIELDVQLTRDEQVVVLHDHTLERTTNGTGFVQNRTYAELCRLEAGNGLHPRFRHARIPLLRDVLAFVRPTRLHVLVELKNFLVPQPHLEEKVLALIDGFGLMNRVVISSFNFNSLLLVKKLEPHVTTALLYVGHLERPWEVARQFRADQLHVPKEEITPSLVEEAHRCGYPVFAWTINGRRTMLRMAQMGVDALITNYPGRARKCFL